MESARKCLECGLPLPGAEDGNHCPNCLFRLAFATQSDGDDELAEQTARPASHPNYFAGYELVSEIAFGGMGVVWKARQLGVNRLVALKMIPAGHLASPQMRLRFRVEIETVAQLDHPHIVPLYETGEHEGQHYFSMKLLEGGNLGEWIARHRNNTKLGEDERKHRREAVRLLIPIARAVHHAHQRGVLHRDLKPSNILLDQQGEPHVADFGLAKVLGRDSGITVTESALGSPNYMAPEQASGHPTQLSVAADVYGLGAVLYELLTGQPPFQAATAVETMRRVVDEEVASPRQLNPAIDADLETICLKCLQKKPAARYDSAEALAADLERWLAGQPIHARPVGPVEQFTRWCRRQPALATALGLSLVLLLVVVVGTAIAGVRIARADRKATTHLRESLLGQARVLRFNTVIGMRDEGLKLIREANALGGPPEYRRALRNELLAQLARTEVSFVPYAHLPASPDPSLNLLSPRGDRYATVTNAQTIRILEAAEGRELTRFNVGNAPIRALEGFSSDGRYLGLRQAAGVSIWDTDTGLLCFATNKPNLVFSFAHDGSKVITQTERKVAVIYELPSLHVIQRLAPYAPESISNSWDSMMLSPDGRTLAAIRSSSRVVELIDVKTQRSRELVNDGRAKSLGWSADSMRLGVGTTARRVMVWDVNSGQRTYISNVLPALPHTIALSEQRALLAAGCEDRVVRFFDSHSPRPVFEMPGESAKLRFAAGGARLQPVLRNATVGFIHLQRPETYFETVVADTDTTPAQCCFSGDSQIIAVNTLTNVTFCNADDGAILTNLSGTSYAAGFAPRDYSFLASRTSGLFQWTLQTSNEGSISLGNQMLVHPVPGWSSFTYSAAGERFAAANYYSNAVFVFDRTLTNRLFVTGPHPGVQFVSLSPDARWVVTGSEADRQLRIWNATNIQEVLALPGGSRPKAAFSPDGKWFAAFGVGFELREVGGDWPRVPLFRDQEHTPVLGAAAFSPDGRTLAVVTDVRAVHLIDLRSLQTLAVLRPPGATEIHALAFSPDGTRLATVGDAVRLRVWNLPVLRQQLSGFGLDW
jgi:WD40 repeat protein